ncbi:dTDP-4-dehydrorhamnose reductase [Wenyingzhuangia sp. 1_MG-2023]|nr:dTDP-4-dehydrorhamnose reductase [Wenyingzhuangia sp. 1_MG-2023]
MSNILVTGAKGQLGSEIQFLASQYNQYHFFFTNTPYLDVTDKEQVRIFCLKNKIQTIINCAAYTNVEKAEEFIDSCNNINHLATKNLSAIAKEQDIQLIHISTDYIFDGKQHVAYTETDTPNPLNMYGKTKWLGEQALLEINPKNSIIIRTSWVYSSYGNNFVKSMLKLAKTKNVLNIVSDQIGTPTYAADLAKTILDILPKIDNQNVEIYHYSNDGVCSWYDFAFEIFQQQKSTCKVYPITSKEYPTTAKRPLFALLNKSKIKNTFDIEIPHWKTSLADCIKKL